MLIENGFTQLILNDKLNKNDPINKTNKFNSECMHNKNINKFKIGLTQPRRVAATTLSQRVQSEMIDEERITDIDYLN